ncbi:MAG TPA: VanW family protein [Anaerolineales bacterium]|jgi:vancomycin resistance protein YoaR|nr:VanW family protein [Anaerolineales bacterium]HQX16966.1 VanW family protein [Anaerolineales bacterium]
MASISKPYQPTPAVPQILAALVTGATLFLGIIVVWTLGYQLLYAGRIFPGVSVAGVSLSGLTRDEAALKLSQTLSYPITGKILFRDGEKVWVASPAELGMVFDPSSTAGAAFQLGRSGGLFGSLSGQIQARSAGVDVPAVILFDQRVATQYLSQISAQIDQPLAEASLELEGTNVVAKAGQVGRELKIEATMVYLGAQLQTFTDGEVSLVVQEIQPQILDVSAQADAARQVLSQPLTLSIQNSTDGDPGPYVYDAQVLASLLGVQRAQNGTQTEAHVVLNSEGLRNLLNPIKAEVDRAPSNAKFIFNDDTKQLDLMEDSKTGRAMDVNASIATINDALFRGEHTVSLVINEAQPKIPGAATGQELGITELIASETSYFYGSSQERIQNIKAAAERFHGVMIAPGEIFSMGAAMGDVSLENGFAEALIIFGGRTIKGVGGGVCQVSTTLFRAVFNAGFPVVERYSHAYRVSYYEMTASGAVDPDLAGLDATVYFPLVDFKFKNDSPYWILMETYVNESGRSLTWKMYSTSTGRTVSWNTTGPVNIVPAPPPLLEENPELKKNEMKQVDYAANGADVTVTRTVSQDGAVLFQDQFVTHYEPWQAICEFGPDSRNPEKLAAEKKLCRNPST